MLNPNFDALDAMQVLAAFSVITTELPSASLNVRIAPGTFRNSSGNLIAYAGMTSKAMPASATTYVWLTDGGVLTQGTAWPATGIVHVRLAVVTTSASAVTAIADARFCFFSAAS